MTNKTKVSSRVISMTPSMASRYLERNDNNRPVRANMVMKYSGQMKNHEWVVNGEPIIIDLNGNVLDGQHRLLACVESGTSFSTLIVDGVPGSYFDTIDTGSNRSSSDILSIAGYATNTARIAASAARFSILFAHNGQGQYGQNKKDGHLITPKRILEWVEANPRIVEISEAIQVYGRTHLMISATNICFLWFFMEQKDRRGTEEFWRGVITGVSLSESDPRLALRVKFDSIKIASIKWPTRSKLGITIRAWKCFVEGRDVSTPANLFRHDTLDSAFRSILPEE